MLVEATADAMCGTKDSNLQTTVHNSIASVGEMLEAKGEDLELVLGIVNEFKALDLIESRKVSSII